ncbi:RagB/SusD family nutrient uptake outer membrane protein [Dawidia soli]|uniref:RagB/SusD family nutrient uptake outer membrane protein n=1 Tax=Dawidia soli TaxID=2782352 RepID=A0AAP2D678_9BACT|nr:RagB/SusD family nutrient uptake outer membrane protein [Dawidia soli]MBT1686131.1 RagB/SusD family nutrient uptake outer membrane protein [Dawidia soli]
MTLKQYIIGTALLATALCSTRCTDDLLDTVPNDRLAQSFFWKTENDAKFAVNAAYPYLDDPNRIFRRDAYSDIGHVNEFFSVNALVEQNLDASSSVVAEEWTFAYNGIAAANFVLDNIDKIPVTDANTAALAQYKSEARVLRAYQYIKLVGLFGDVPLVKKNISIEEARQLTRTPSNEIWDFVDAELHEAVDGLKDTYPAADKGRMTKGAALALAARANLYAGRMEKAIAAAQAVMDLHVYDIYPEYGKLFSYGAENNIEVIIDRQYLKDVLSNQVFAIMAPYSVNNTTSPSPNMYVPTKALADMYTMNDGIPITDAASGFDPYNPYTNRDPRLTFSLFVPGSNLPNGKIFDPRPNSGTPDAIGSTYFAPSTGYAVKKYVNIEDLNSKTNNGINIIQLRYAEVLLTYAEAKIALNQIDASVLDAINDVRRRNDVNLPALEAGLTQDELTDIVRRERTIELAFEGHRLFDIRRWRIAGDVVPGNVYGITYDDGGTLKTIEVPSFTKQFDPSRNYLWPIPQNERVLNPNLSKNDGW